MKIQSLEINNLRGIEHLTWTFQDSLGLTRGRSLIVGPNTCGKTTVLDAIALCLMPLTQGSTIRPGIELSPSALVRQGTVQTTVRCVVAFTEEEEAAVRELHQRLNLPLGEFSESGLVEVEWTFPDLDKGESIGRHRLSPDSSQALFSARTLAWRALHVPGVARLLDTLGGVFLFDQQRTTKEASPDPDNLSFPRPGSLDWLPVVVSPPASSHWSAPGFDKRFLPATTPGGDNALPRALVTLLVRAQARQERDAAEQLAFRYLEKLFARICHPHRILGLLNTESGLDLEFEGEQGPYRFAGLSSGQRVILSLLLRFATERIHRSIVLIDELELHLHPTWQSHLYHSLMGLGSDNQFLVTTHSLYLRSSASPSECLNLGKLTEHEKAPAEVA